MRLMFAAALAVSVASFTGCYRSMYAPPYGYTSPGYGGYPGPINTLTPGQQYVPGSTIGPGGTFVQPGVGGDAPPYSPTVVPGNNSATRPVPTYGSDPGSDASGINSMGSLQSAPVLQRAQTPTFVTRPQPMPLTDSAPLSPVNEFVQPTASTSSAF